MKQDKNNEDFVEGNGLTLAFLYGMVYLDTYNDTCSVPILPCSISMGSSVNLAFSFSVLLCMIRTVVVVEYHCPLLYRFAIH